jgi:cell wall-associated NlpC family hydrolase
MGAAGVAGAAMTWMQREPFEEWLTAAARAGGRDDQAGTVLVWRDANQGVQHAAMTLGDGWAMHKPSQGWMSPTKVLSVREVIYSARVSGHRLKRYTLG